MNKHQKAAHRPGEQKVDRATVNELLDLSCSADAEDRLTAAKYLCPCHVQTRIDEAWAALFRMMEDSDARVRQQAWHALEDGGIPSAPGDLARLEAIYEKEKDGKVRRFAWEIIGETVRQRRNVEMKRQQLAMRPPPRQKGKCDFCGATNVMVRQQYDVVLAGGRDQRAALICEKCEA